MVDVRRKHESRHCIECFRCVSPNSAKTMAVSYRPMGEEVENIEYYNPNKVEVWFFFLGTGSALGGFLWLILPIYQTFRQKIGEWAINQEWYWIGDSGPGWLMSVHPERREVFNWLDFTTALAQGHTDKRVTNLLPGLLIYHLGRVNSYAFIGLLFGLLATAAMTAGPPATVRGDRLLKELMVRVEDTLCVLVAGALKQLR